MPTLSAAADAHINASPEVVLAILRDLDGHHRRILPPAFSDFEVLHGGQGDGTLSRFKFRLGGKTTEERTLTTETNPGVIREQVLGRDMVTEFRVVDEGAGSRVSIATTWTAQNAVVGIARAIHRPAAAAPGLRPGARAAGGLCAVRRRLACRRAAGRPRWPRPTDGSTGPSRGRGRATASTGACRETGAGGRSAGSRPRARRPPARERPETAGGCRRETRSRRRPPHRGFASSRSRRRDDRRRFGHPVRRRPRNNVRGWPVCRPGITTSTTLPMPNRRHTGRVNGSSHAMTR